MKGDEEEGESIPIESDNDLDPIIENCFLRNQIMNDEITQIKEFLNGCETTLGLESVGQHVADMSNICVIRPIATYNKEFNHIELFRLQELSTIHDIWQISRQSRQYTPKIIEFSTIEEWYKNREEMTIYDQGVRLFIECCKGISSFREICRDDQLALVKYGLIESAIWQHLLCDFNKEHLSIHTVSILYKFI